MNRRAFGCAGETLAAAYLEKKGYVITARNVYIGGGEIDLIAETDKDLVFVEVKTRTEGRSIACYGPPAAAVNAKKKRILMQAAQRYLYEHPTDKQPRIDVMEVYVTPRAYTVGVMNAGSRIVHYENAVRKS